MTTPRRTFAACLTVWALGMRPAHAQTNTIGVFTPTGSMAFSRNNHTATLLPDGTVLIAGGCGAPSGQAGCDPLRSAERYDPATGTFAPTGDMNQARSGHTATLLQNGTVLVAGGVGTDIASAEIYDPATGLFTPTGSMVVARVVDPSNPTPVVGRSFHTATRLDDGRVLLTGGEAGGAIADAEIFDPSSGLFSAIDGSCSTSGSCAMSGPRYFHTATLLGDGTVLIVGGLGGSPVAAELYLTVPGGQGSFSSLPTQTAPRFGHTATRLPNGQVLLAGGQYQDDQGVPHGWPVAEIYDPPSATTSFVVMQASRSQHSATLLASGHVLLAGGISDDGTPLLYPEAFDPATGTFSSFVGSMIAARYAHTATMLDSGRVLVAGGAGATAPIGWSAEVFEPAPHANDGTLSVVEDTPATGMLTATAPAGSVLFFTILSTPHGTTVLTDPFSGAFTYTPLLNEYGQSFITFKVSGAGGESNIGTIIVNISPVDDAPVAQDGWATTAGAAPLSGSLFATDIDSPSLTFSVVANPTKGTVAVATAGRFTYTPGPGASGDDSFTFIANDGLLVSNVATVHVHIDEAPVASSDTIEAIQGSPAGGPLQVVDADLAYTNGLTFSIVGNPTKGTVAIVNSRTGRFTYTPAANATGLDSFTFKANDGLLDSNVATITIVIRTPPQGFDVLHASTEAAAPQSALALGPDGNLYGVSQGGAGEGGSIFRLMPAGLTEVVFRFPASVPGSSAAYPLGCHPVGRLARRDSDEVFFGVASGCGEHDGGTLYQITLGGAFTKLYDFPAGSQPNGGVATDGVTVYGTTMHGGDANLGTVFSDRVYGGNGTLQTLHNFAGPDGQWPAGDVVLSIDGNVYGSTLNGGCGGTSGCSDANDGPGTIFRVTPSGTFTQLHAFAGGGAGSSDGGNPLGGLVESNYGTFYGTTARGGANDTGIAFRVDRNGVFQRVHDFSAADGRSAGGLLAATDGQLYGAVTGGAADSGMLFRMTANGIVTPLHAFTGTDGRTPMSGLAQGADGRLYGSTSAGGLLNFGTLFSLPMPASVRILANNAAGPLVLPRDSATAISFAAHAASGATTIDPADLFAGVLTPLGVYWLNSSLKLVTTPSRLHSGPLPTFGPATIFSVSNLALPAGSYTWFIAVVSGNDLLVDAVQTTIGP